MQGVFLRKYGVQTTVDFVLFEVDGVDFRVNAVHAAGDTKIMGDEGAEANTANAFVDEGQGYSIVLSAVEMQAARNVIYIVDQGAKAWLDTRIVIETYGNPAAMHAFDLDIAQQIVASVTGNVGGNVVGSVASVVGNVGGNVVGTVASVVGAVGSVAGNVVGSVGSVVGNVGGNVVGTVASVVGAVGSVAGNVGGNVVGTVASVVGAVGSVAGNVAGNVTGSVGSVLGNVAGNVVGSVGSVLGNVAGSVASVVGNVGGNIVGTVASVVGNVGGSVASMLAAGRNQIADSVLSRAITNTEAAAPFRSLTGAIAKLVNHVRAIGGNLVTYETDDVTPYGTQALTTDATADPIIRADTV